MEIIKNGMTTDGPICLQCVTECPTNCFVACSVVCPDYVY
jgi:hypothetical protein